MRISIAWVTHDVPEVFRLGIDLGCGTGLSGEVFQTRVQRMIGVDLSEKMLACAREKNIYSELVHADGSAFLDQMAESADLFVAADIFVYVGALEALFGLIRSRSLPGALFAFSTEKASGNGYVLQKSGRFAHSPDYIAELAAANGFAVRTCSDVRGRMERGAWVSSQIFVLQLV
jgi:predicted TPR repeat methyltransferase